MAQNFGYDANPIVVDSYRVIVVCTRWASVPCANCNTLNANQHLRFGKANRHATDMQSNQLEQKAHRKVASAGASMGWY